MRKRGRRLGQAERRNGAAKLLTGIAVMLIVAVFVDARIRPVVEDMTEYQAKVFAFRTINSAMMDEIGGESIEYGDLVHIARDTEGQVTSVETDMLAVNRLKARMADTVARQLENRDNQTFYVPVGTLLGSQITSGRGPKIEVQVIPVGYVQSELYNNFTSAGINQTSHQVMMKTTVQMVAILPGYTVKTEASTSFCIAETVIVGAVPDGFTVVTGDDAPIIGKINDYGAQVSP